MDGTAWKFARLAVDVSTVVIDYVVMPKLIPAGAVKEVMQWVPMVPGVGKYLSSGHYIHKGMDALQDHYAPKQFPSHKVQGHFSTYSSGESEEEEREAKSRREKRKREGDDEDESPAGKAPRR
jgi:hypothetical protein